MRKSLDTVLRVGLMLVVAVLDMPFSVLLVIQFSIDVSNNRGSGNISPFLNVTLSGNLVELGASLDLEGAVSHLVEETRRVGDISTNELIISAKGEVLFASINTSGVVVNMLRALIPEELLVLVINNKFLKTAAGLFTVQNKRGGLMSRLLVVQVEAVVRLHGSELGLLATSSPGKTVRDSVAIFDVDIEVNIRVQWDRLTSERRLSEGITPSVVSWAGKSSLGSLLELLEGKIPALEDFTSAKVENLR